MRCNITDIAMAFPKRLGAILLLSLLALFAGCAAPNAIETTSIAAASRSIQDYRLDAGDRVRLIVFNEPTLSGEFAVSANGVLSVPLIGDVPAAGRTTPEISKEIETRLADGYLREPRVSMDVLTYRPFFILGEVEKPGQYPYAGGLTVLNAVATAQGFTYRAEKRVAYIRRAGSEEEKAYRISPDLPVEPGDTIRIGERYF